MNDEQVTISPETVQRIRDGLLATILAAVLERGATTNGEGYPLADLNADLRPGNSRVNLDIRGLIQDGALRLMAGDIVEITPHGVTRFERIVGIQKLVKGSIQVRAHAGENLLSLNAIVSRWYSGAFKVVSSDFDYAARTVTLSFEGWLPAPVAALYQ